MKQKTTLKILVLFIILLNVSSLIQAQNTPPSLTDFHQFYGGVTNLPAGNFILAARNNDTGTEEVVAVSNNQYGYNPTLKISGSGNDMINFYVIDTSGTEQHVGVAYYIAGAITEFNLDYQILSTASSTLQTQEDQGGGNEEVTEDQENQESTVVNESEDQSDTENRITCNYNWECTGWSACQVGSQTRSCTRIDNCDEDTMDVNPIPRPDEQRSCTTSTTTTTQQICTPGSQRCSGNDIEQCSFDGSEWEFVRTCTDGCDSLLVICNQPPTTSPSTQQASSSSFFSSIWFWVILISAVVVLAGGGTAAYLIVENQKKYAPVKEYIQKARERGLPDQHIKTRLVTRGWDSEKVDKLLDKK